MFIGRAARDVHVARVPLIGEGWHGVDAPVDEDAELGVAEPFRRAVGRDGIAGCSVQA